MISVRNGAGQGGGMAFEKSHRLASSWGAVIYYWEGVLGWEISCSMHKMTNKLPRDGPINWMDFTILKCWTIP